MRPLAAKSPRGHARLTGLFYLLTMLLGIVAQGVISARIIVAGDGAATAANILAHKSLFRWGFTFYLVEMTCQIIFTALLYELLKPVNRSISLVAAFLGLAGCAIKTVSRLFYIAPLLLLGGTPAIAGFSQQQLHGLALFSLQVNDQGAGVALAFFGFHALLAGYLTAKSAFLPRLLGLWSMLAGVGWLAFLYPPLGFRWFPYLAAVGFLGAAALIVWLLVFGVDEAAWRRQAAAA